MCKCQIQLALLSVGGVFREGNGFFFFFFLKKPTGVAALERVAGVYGPSLAVLYRLSFSIVDTLTRSVAMATLSCLLFFPFVYDETIDKGPVNRRRASLTDDVHLEISVGR